MLVVAPMPHARRLPLIPPTGRCTVKISSVQRNLVQAAPGLPAALGHLLRHAPVTKGKLSVRLTKNSIATLITAAAGIEHHHAAEQREITALLRYLESLEDQFADAEAGATHQEKFGDVSFAP